MTLALQKRTLSRRASEMNFLMAFSIDARDMWSHFRKVEVIGRFEAFLACVTTSAAALVLRPVK